MALDPPPASKRPSRCFEGRGWQEATWGYCDQKEDEVGFDEVNSTELHPYLSGLPVVEVALSTHNHQSSRLLVLKIKQIIKQEKSRESTIPMKQ